MQLLFLSVLAVCCLCTRPDAVAALGFTVHDAACHLPYARAACSCAAHLRSLSRCKASDVQCEAQRWTLGHCVTSGCHARRSHVRRGACAEHAGTAWTVWAPRQLRISATLAKVRTLPPCPSHPPSKPSAYRRVTVTAPVTVTSSTHGPCNAVCFLVSYKQLAAHLPMLWPAPRSRAGKRFFSKVHHT